MLFFDSFYPDDVPYALGFDAKQSSHAMSVPAGAAGGWVGRRVGGWVGGWVGGRAGRGAALRPGLGRARPHNTTPPPPPMQRR